MTVTGLTNRVATTTLARMRWTTAIVLAGTLAGCINITAPDKPIQINLNINVTQEVVYRLDGDAKSLIQQNPGIF